MNSKLVSGVFFGLTVFIVYPLQAEETRHPHHLGLGFGVAGHDGETSGFLGLDYSYRFKNDMSIFLFAEDVSGDFEIQAYGFGIGKYFDSGWKTGAGLGVEKKLESGKNLNLFHIGAGYDWHKGNWSYGPVVNIDFIEQGNQTYYLGWAFGYGF